MQKATLTKETITVSKPVQGKYGPQVLAEGGNYYSFSRNYRGGQLSAGATYNVEVEVTEKGYKYIVTADTISTLLSSNGSQTQNNPLINKDGRILAQGLWQAAIQAPALAALAGDSEALIKLANEVALAGMKFVKENS